MTIDLKSMSFKELKQLRNQVDRAIKNTEAREKRAALKAAEAAASQFGFTLAEVTSGEKAPKKRGPKPKSAAAKKPGKPKYRNPADKAQTWTGKGRQPAWYKSAIESGKKPSDLEI